MLKIHPMTYLKVFGLGRDSDLRLPIYTCPATENIGTKSEQNAGRIASYTLPNIKMLVYASASIGALVGSLNVVSTLDKLQSTGSTRNINRELSFNLKMASRSRTVTNRIVEFDKSSVLGSGLRVAQGVAVEPRLVALSGRKARNSLIHDPETVVINPLPELMPSNDPSPGPSTSSINSGALLENPAYESITPNISHIVARFLPSSRVDSNINPVSDSVEGSSNQTGLISKNILTASVIPESGMQHDYSSPEAAHERETKIYGALTDNVLPQSETGDLDITIQNADKNLVLDNSIFADVESRAVVQQLSVAHADDVAHPGSEIASSVSRRSVHVPKASYSEERRRAPEYTASTIQKKGTRAAYSLPSKSQKMTTAVSAVQQSISRPMQTWNGIEFSVATRVHGKSAGTLNMLIANARVDYPEHIGTDISVKLSDVLSLLSSKFKPDSLQRLSNSSAAQNYVTLNELRLRGIPVSFSDDDVLVFGSNQ